MKKIIFIITAVLLVNLALASECGLLEDKITSSKIICKNTYTVPEGITIQGNNLLIDFNNSTFIGDNSGIGITIKDSFNLTLKNIKIINYQSAILAESSVFNIENSSISSNILGIYLKDSYFTQKNSIIEKNKKKDILKIFSNNSSGNQEKKEDLQKTRSKDEEIITNIVEDSLLSELPVRILDHQKALEHINFIKSKEITEDSIIFTIKVKAIEDTENLVLYEYFPKELAEDASEITSSHDFEIIEKDPVIKINIGKLKKDEEAVIVFEIKNPKEVKNPLSIFTIETRNNNIKTLMYSSYILFFIMSFLTVNLEKRYKKAFSFVNSRLDKGYSEKNIKDNFQRAGWPSSLASEIINIAKQKNLKYRIKGFLNNYKSLITIIVLITYLSLFWIFDLGVKIFLSEPIAFYSLIAINLFLILRSGKIFWSLMRYMFVR